MKYLNISLAGADIPIKGANRRRGRSAPFMEDRETMNSSAKKQNGFTLIEVMVVVVIIGILASIAYPSYMEVVRQTRRADAYNALMDIMARQERYFTDNNSYTDDLKNLGFAEKTYTTPDGYYLVSAAACGTGIGTCVALTATGQKGQEKDGKEGACKTLTLDSTDVKTPADCWKK